MNSKLPLCAVLMATYNGECWLNEQLNSICVQEGVALRLIVSDDSSSDGSLSLLSEFKSKLPLTLLPTPIDRLGSANRNFMRLIQDADIGEAEFIAFADQDDIWRADKLLRAVTRLNHECASAYSSDFEAFWPDGSKRIIKKSHNQKQFDYLFGSPGPGCTFVIRRSLFLEMRVWITANLVALSSLWVHDWILYAYARSHGHLWLIDCVPTLLYRQHESNTIGVNFGIKAAMQRLAVVKEGRYRNDIVVIAELTGANPECVRALRRLKWTDRLWLILHASHYRRSPLEVLALRLIFVLMPAIPLASV